MQLNRTSGPEQSSKSGGRWQGQGRRGRIFFERLRTLVRRQESRRSTAIAGRGPRISTRRLTTCWRASPTCPPMMHPTARTRPNNAEVKPLGRRARSSILPRKRHFGDLLAIAAQWIFEKPPPKIPARGSHAERSLARVYTRAATVHDRHPCRFTNGLTEYMTACSGTRPRDVRTDKTAQNCSATIAIRPRTAGWFKSHLRSDADLRCWQGMCSTKPPCPAGWGRPTPCASGSEAGSAGRRATSGICCAQPPVREVGWWFGHPPRQSDGRQKRMLRCAEDMLEPSWAALPHRDPVHRVGHGLWRAGRTFDHEAWLPGQNALPRDQLLSRPRGISGPPDELHGQARRCGKPQFVHTLNGSWSGRRALPDRRVLEKTASKQWFASSLPD